MQSSFELGNEYLYFGNPHAWESYTNCVTLRTEFSEWKYDLEGLYDGKELEFLPKEKDISEIQSREEDRFVRGTKQLLITSSDVKDDIASSEELYEKYCQFASIKKKNDDFLDFENYVKDILNVDLPDVQNSESLSQEDMQKYLDLEKQYEDSDYSKVFIEKPNFYQWEKGIFITTDKFKDFHFRIDINDDYGIVRFTMRLEENSSHYNKD